MAKLVTYKPTKPDSAAGKPAVVKALGQHTRAINQVGLVSNSIGKIAQEMKSIAGATIAFQNYQQKKKKKQARLEKDRAAENEQEGKILPDGRPEGNINEGDNADLEDDKTSKEAGGWLEKIFGPFQKFLGGIISLVITKAVFDYMKDPKSAETVQWAVETVQKVFGFLAKWVKGSVENLLGGMGKVFDSNAPFWERLKGFGQMLLGFLGLAALMNPFGLMMGIIALCQNLAGLVEKVIDLVKKFQDWWRKKAGKAAQKTIKAADSAKDALKGADNLKDAKKSKGIISRVADSKIGKTVTGAVDGVRKALDPKKIGNLAKKFLPKVDVGKATKGIGDWFAGAGKTLRSGVDWGAKKVVQGAKFVGNEALKHGKNLHKNITSAWSGFGDMIRKYGDKAKNIIIEKVLKPAKKQLQPLFKRMKGLGGVIEKQLKKIPVFEWIQKVLKKKGAKGITSLGPVLKQIGPKAIDIIGGIVNMVFAYDRFAQGDSIGGLIEGASGILDLSGLPPPIGLGFYPVGPRLSLMLDAYMFARDLLPDMFPEAPNFKEGEDKMIESIGLGGIKGKLDSILSKLPDLSTITGWITGNKDAKDPPTEAEEKAEADKSEMETDMENFADGGEFTHIPMSHFQPMSEGGELGEMSEEYSFNEEDLGDAIPFAMPIIKGVAVHLPMPINSGGEVIQGSRSPLLDRI